MSKQLYEEAIADLKKVKEIAEDNAKRVVVEAVAPRIRELIEKELLGESLDEEDAHSDHGAPGSVDKPGEVLTDKKSEEDSEDETQETAESISFTELAHAADEDEESEEHLMSSDKTDDLQEMDQKLRYVERMVEMLCAAEKHIVESKDFKSSISHVNDMIDSIYGYMQERIENPTSRLGYGLKLKNCLEKIEKLQETKMKRDLLNEEDITLELTGLPDDVDLENLGVNLVSKAGEEESEEAPEAPAGDEEDLDLDLDAGDEGAEESSEEGSEEGEESEEKLESLAVGDDVIVEIDEKMLRNEITRLKALREEASVSVDGDAPAADEFDDFGGAEELDDALELELTTESDDDAVDEAGYADEAYHMESDDAESEDEEEESVDEMHGMMHGMDEEYESEGEEEESDEDMDEADSLDQGAKHRKGGAGYAEDVLQPNVQQNEAIRTEMANELKLQESLRKRASQLKKLYEASKASSTKAKTLVERKQAASRGDELKAAYTATAERYNRSVAKFNKLSESLSKASVKNNTRSNNVATPDASAGSDTLSKKLAETNLLNAKLLFTNKLLQTESLTARQKAQVIEQLDAAETIREAKLVYESLSKALVKPRRVVTEGRVLGSSSQATRAASTQTTTLNEGVEAERWARLAGIK
jgi:hypothetical protein